MSKVLAPMVARAASGAAVAVEETGSSVAPAEEPSGATATEPSVAPAEEPSGTTATDDVSAITSEVPAEPEISETRPPVGTASSLPRAEIQPPLSDIAVSDSQDEPHYAPFSPEARRPMTVIRKNRVFDHLIEGDDDVIGLIAYSLYKKDKRDWLIAWTNQNGAEPTAEQMAVFVDAQTTLTQRERYRNAARQVIDAYASVAVDLEKPAIIRGALVGRAEEAARKVETASRWPRRLLSGFIGGALALLVLVGVIAILIAAGVDLAGYLGFEAGGGNGLP